MADVELHNIVKTYNKGKVKAVNDVSFSVNEGELSGLIGADGAGKTSIFRILTTLYTFLHVPYERNDEYRQSHGDHTALRHRQILV